MLIFLAIIALQLACIVHCVRNARPLLWIAGILFFPVVGSLAYLILEVLPAYSGRREVRAVKQAAAKVLDPERDLRRARDALEIADTSANHLALGDALAALGQWAEAVPHYEKAETKSPVAEDRAIRLKLAKANFEAGRSAKARELLESLPPSGSQSENDRAQLLLARLYEEGGEDERALAVYAEVGTRLPGAEAQCRQAALLLALGRRTEAVAPLLEAEKRAKRMDRYERTREAEMYDWAATSLAGLRAEGLQAGS